jgi:hypothetical protein
MKPNINRWIWHHGGQAARQALRDQLDPWSEYWHTRAREAAQEFIDLLGHQAYDEWCDTLPDDKPAPSWREIHNDIRAEINRRMMETSTASCPKHTPDPENCQNLEA